jgi:hypothetical protein
VDSRFSLLSFRTSLLDESLLSKGQLAKQEGR